MREFIGVRGEVNIEAGHYVRSPIAGSVTGPGPYPDEWIVASLSEDAVICLAENLEVIAAPEAAHEFA